MRSGSRLPALLAALALLVVVATIGLVTRPGGPATGGPVASAPSSTPVAVSEPTTDPSPTPTDGPDLVRRGMGEPAGIDALTQFRGNPAHTFYGRGPLPADPEVAWRFPDRAMCSVETRRDGTTKTWCGTGWTGQPLVWERTDGITEVIFNSYDGNVYFLDGDTGEPTRPAFKTGRMVKGTWTLDPDGMPLLYGGSRDHFYRVVALDRDAPIELWRMEPHPQGQWNRDWDGNGSVIDDVLYLGGEDSYFYTVRLNRRLGPDGLVAVDPEVLLATPTFDDAFNRMLGDRQTSIESSVVVADEAIYVSNSGGRILGFDRQAALRGERKVVLDYWVGDDTDGSMILDDEGFLYVPIEWDRKTARAAELGQLIKLDPRHPDDPYVWGVDLHSGGTGDGGLWATPALFGDHLYVPTHRGNLIAVDRHTGEIVWQEPLGFHEWSSPAVVESAERGPELLVAMCANGGLKAFSLTDPAHPVESWTVQIPSGACIESTPAVWKGRIWVGSRDGFFYGFR